MYYLLSLVLLIWAGLSAGDKLPTQEYFDKKFAELQQQQNYTQPHNYMIRSFGGPLGLYSSSTVQHTVITEQLFQERVNTIVDALKEQIFSMLKTANPNVITQDDIDKFWGQQQEGTSFLNKLQVLQKDIQEKVAIYQQQEDKKRKKRELSIKRSYGIGNFLFGCSLGLTVGILGMRYYYELGSFQQDTIWVGNKACVAGKSLVEIGGRSLSKLVK